MKRPLRALLVAGGLLLGSGLTLANPHAGTWEGSFTTLQGRPGHGLLVLTETGGTWRQLSTGGGDPCLTREHPVAIGTATAEDLQFQVQRSRTMAGCQDMNFKLKKVGDKLEGEFDIGGQRPVTFKRK